MSIIHYSQSERVREVRDLLDGHNAPRWMHDELECMIENVDRGDAVSLVIWLTVNGMAWLKSHLSGNDYVNNMRYKSQLFKFLDYRFQNDKIRSGFLELLDYHGHEHVVGGLILRAILGRGRLENRPWYMKEDEIQFLHQDHLNEACEQYIRLISLSNS